MVKKSSFSPKIGVLALQGAFAKHISVLQSLKVPVQTVRTPSDLSVCDGLIIPGGESTAMSLQIDYIGLREPLQKFLTEKPVMGTCAGLIFLAKEVVGHSVPSFSALDISVVRNAYGRQSDSFTATISLNLPWGKHPFQAHFIRAPMIKEVNEGVEILASHANVPVLVRQGLSLGASFHPELTNDPLVHKYFLEFF